MCIRDRCGTAVLREGEIHSLRQLSSAAIRVARQVRNASDPVLGRLCPGGKLVSTLILAPPGAGKTTLCLLYTSQPVDEVALKELEGEHHLRVVIP